jgi:hypothetical protein
MTADVLTAREGQIAIVTLNRPDAMNAMDNSMRRNLMITLDDLARSTDIRAVVLTGAGKAFCSGSDLKGRSPADWDTTVRQLPPSSTGRGRPSPPLPSAHGGGRFRSRRSVVPNRETLHARKKTKCGGSSPQCTHMVRLRTGGVLSVSRYLRPIRVPGTRRCFRPSWPARPPTEIVATSALRTARFKPRKVASPAWAGPSALITLGQVEYLFCDKRQYELLGHRRDARQQ